MLWIFRSALIILEVTALFLFANNSCGVVDSKTIGDMKTNHERVLKKVEKTFNKYLEI